MPIVKVEKTLSSEERRRLIDELEKLGSGKLLEDLKRTLLKNLPPQLLNDKEFLSRYLLLAAVLDQQAESNSARGTVSMLYNEYGYQFFMDPKSYLDKIHEIVGKALKTYRPKVRVLRMKITSITLSRIGGYMLAIHSLALRYGGLLGYFRRFQNPKDLLERGILGEIMFSSLLYEKAARLYVGWVTHPDLPVSVYGTSIPRNSIPMVVNGHVGKVMARTGFLEKVSVEDLERKIIEAEKERSRIERLVESVKPNGDFFAIDYGAFLVGINYCHEEKPDCSRCILNTLCKKNIEIRAY